jgi:two-component system LytT family response regulator
MKAVVIDDESKAREYLSRMLHLVCPDVEVTAEAEDVKGGVKLIGELRPDLVFLDINMPDGTGFDLLDRVGPIHSKIIFVTAHNEFAINAFKVNALDYLLKPLDPGELSAAVSKVREALLQNLHAGNKFLDQNKKIYLNSNDSMEVVTIGDITYCEADRMYSILHISGNRKIVLTKTLKDLEEKFSGYGFFRVHKSYLVNMQRVERFNKTTNELKMDNASRIIVSHRKRESLLELLKGLG